MRPSLLSFAAFLGLVVLFADAFTYNVDTTFAAYEGETYHDYAADHVEREHKPGSCAYEGEKLCPPAHSSMGIHFDAHVRCLIPKVRKLPRHCWAAIEDLDHCVGDMTHYCDRLSTIDTMVCLEQHLDVLHDDCKASMFMHHAHREAGRDTSAYRDYYNEYQRRDERYRDKRIPVEDL